MVSTVTTTTVATIISSAIAGSMALVGMLVLLALLIQKELAEAIVSSRTKTLVKVLNIGIIPLLVAFAAIVFSRIAEIIR